LREALRKISFARAQIALQRDDIAAFEPRA
jgi:hypothetical protein